MKETNNKLSRFGGIIFNGHGEETTTFYSLNSKLFKRSGCDNYNDQSMCPRSPNSLEFGPIIAAVFWSSKFLYRTITHSSWRQRTTSTHSLSSRSRFTNSANGKSLSISTLTLGDVAPSRKATIYDKNVIWSQWRVTCVWSILNIKKNPLDMLAVKNETQMEL